MIGHEYPFSVMLATEFTSNALYENQHHMLAHWIQDPDAEYGVRVEAVTPANHPPTKIDFYIAEEVFRLGDFDHLCFDIMQGLSEQYDLDMAIMNTDPRRLPENVY